MDILYIMPPDMNDSFSRVVLDGKPYLIRFTWSNLAQRWSFGLYTTQKEPIAVGLRIVPRFPLNLQLVDDKLPPGVFGVYSDSEYVGRKDFVDGKAKFAYISGGDAM